MKIEVNILGLDGAIAALSAMPAEIERRITAAITKDIWLVSAASQQNVDGPRPTNLGKLSGNLYKSLGENVSVTTVDNQIIGETGTDITSTSGFPYPKYWESPPGFLQGKGTHSPWPRPFLKPALDSIADQFLRDMQEAVRG